MEVPKAIEFPLALLVGAVSFVAGTFLVLLGTECLSGDYSDAGEEAYRTWGLLVGLMFAVGAWMAMSQATSLRWIWREFPVDLRTTALAAAIFVAAAWLPGLLRDRPFPDPGFCGGGSRPQAVALLGSIIFLPGIVLLDWIRQAAEAGTPGSTDLGRYLELRSRLDRSLKMLAGVIALGLLATSALRRAVIEAGGVYYQADLVLTGLQFSALLLIFYWPAHERMNDFGKAVRDRRLPQVALDDQNFVDRQAAREAADKLLATSTGPLDALRASLAIISPLATALLATFVSDRLA